KGTVRGDTEFDRASLDRLENHLLRPEVQQALSTGVGRAERLSASTNERRMYVAVRGGPGGPAVVRVSTTLAAVDTQVDAVPRTVALTGLGAILAAGALAWLLSQEVAKPLVQLGGAARAIADGRRPAFPDSRVPEVAQHIVALRDMNEQLDQRFTDLVREREETATLIETMADGVVAADARGAIVTNGTHELKTPLTSIAGYAETLALEATPGTQTERFTRPILSNARRMHRLVDDLLDLSRIESGRWQPDPERVDVRGLAEEAWAAFADRARERQIQFSATVGNVRYVTADSEALRQVLTNLFDNALRYTPPAGRIAVS